MPVLPWVYDLGVLTAVQALDCVPVRDGVLDADARDIAVKQPVKKVARLIQLSPSFGVTVQPSNARLADVRARRVSDHQVPSIVDDVED